MTVYMVLNQQKPEALQVAEQAAAILQQQGACTVWPDADPARDEAALASADAVLTIGGDGTILHTARRTQPYGIPILGINLGRVGFLATCEIEEMPSKLARLAASDYQLDRRMLLRARCDAWEQTALNDVVLYKGWRMQTIEFAVWCDGTLVNRYRGDGVIVATPTGSTAYSLSAGGPILDARIGGMVVTPICAHSLQSPPMVFSAQRRLTIRVGEYTGSDPVCVSADGAGDHSLSPGAQVEISLADSHLDLISFNPADQFMAIDKKLKGR